MEEKLPSAGKSALYYGLVLGVALIVVSLILYLVEQQKEPAGIAIGTIALVAGIVLVQLDFRNKKLGGFISYGKAVKIAFLTMIFTGIIVALYTFVYHSYINTNDLLETRTEQIQGIYNRGMDAATEEQSIKWIEMTTTPLVSAIMVFISYPIIGLIIALLSSIFIKKDENVSLS